MSQTDPKSTQPPFEEVEKGTIRKPPETFPVRETGGKGKGERGKEKPGGDSGGESNKEIDS